MNNNFKNNRAYGMGFNDGYQKGINDCEDELINVKTQLQDERVINKKIKAEADEIKAEADEIKAEADKIKAEAAKQSERIDELEVTVDNVLDVLNGLQTEYNNNSSEMQAIVINRTSMESENKEIGIVLNDYVNFGAIKSDFVKEHIKALIAKKESNSAEIRRGERNFSKLQKQNVGINSNINNFKVKNFDLIASAVKNLTA